MRHLNTIAAATAFQRAKSQKFIYSNSSAYDFYLFRFFITHEIIARMQFHNIGEKNLINFFFLSTNSMGFDWESVSGDYSLEIFLM